MQKQNNVISPFNSPSKFNKEEEHIRTILEKDNEEVLFIDINYKFPDGARPIHYACLYNSLNFFTNPNLPLSNLNLPGGVYGSTPMMFTIYNSSYKALLFLLLNDADITIRNTKSSDVLSLCVRFDDILGLILVLSFMNGSRSIKRYLKYSLMKNSIRTWDFLNKRGIEIECDDNKKKDCVNDGDTKDINIDTQDINIDTQDINIDTQYCGTDRDKREPINQYSNHNKEPINQCSNHNKVHNINHESIHNRIEDFKAFLSLSFFIILSIYSNGLRLFISSCFLFIYFAILSSPIPLVFNVLYSVYAYFILISSRPSSFCVYFVVFLHSVSFFIIYFMKNPQMKINKIREVKEIITHLVLEDEYNTTKFCYTCLNLKEEGNKHCKICKKCIIGHNHHCPFFNKCITKKTIVVFNMFIFFSMILYTLAIIETPLRLSKVEFLICLFVSVGSFVMFLISWKQKNG